MQNKLIFTKKKPDDFQKKKKILNFLNLESLWHYKNNPLYSKLISEKHNINFPDGRLIGLKLGTIQQRGPAFTKEFLTSKKAKSQKHFFIGDVDTIELPKITGITKKQLAKYNPPYIKGHEFSSEDKKKIITMLKKFKPDYIWVCIGAPKQEILTNQLFKSYPSTYSNVGTALDFLLGKKAEASKIWRKLGLEWAYRGATDFKHSRKKIWMSLMGLKCLKKVGLK